MRNHEVCVHIAGKDLKEVGEGDFSWIVTKNTRTDKSKNNRRPVGHKSIKFPVFSLNSGSQSNNEIQDRRGQQKDENKLDRGLIHVGSIHEP